MSKDPADLSQPHDRLFKEVFGRPDTAAGFFQAYLPAPLAGVLDWDSLTLQPGSYVDEALQHRESDLLYRVQAREGELWLYCLFEHQRAADRWMMLRLLGYMLRIWERFRKEHPLAPLLPPIVPIALHQGKTPWNVATSFEELVSRPEEFRGSLAPFVPVFTHRLVDLAPLDFQQLQGTILGRLTLRALKAAGEDRVPEFFEQSADLWERLAGAEDGPGLIHSLLLYLYHADSSVDKRVFRTKVLKLTQGPVRATAMSIAEQLIEEGRQEGRQEGRDEGLHLGILVANIQHHQRLLKCPVKETEDLANRSLEELEALLHCLQADLGKPRE